MQLTPKRKPIAPAQWEKIEARFRRWSFGVFFERAFATEPDPAVRLAKATMASEQPIVDRQAVLAWYRQQRRKKRRGKRRAARQPGTGSC
jgi:hypothetical protein